MTLPTLHELAERIAELERRLASSESRAPGTPAPVGSGPNAHGEIPWHVLAAAIAAALPGPYRMKSVTVIPPAPAANLWASEGRREHCYSHRLR